jgi:hypothetical protein
MYGFQNLPSQQQQRFWFYAGASGSTAFRTWNKPPGISFVHIICIGGSGGGGGGSARRAGVSIIGATGGASGAMTSTLLPSYNTPDILYILPGYGGNGGQGGLSGSGATPGLGSVGTAGTPSYVCYYPNTAAGYVLNIANGGGGGIPGQQGNGSCVGGAAAASTAYPISQFGLRTSITGHGYLASTAGNAGALYRITAGGGNASIINTPSAGGVVQPAGELFQTVPSGQTQGAPGNNGMIDLQKFISYGGTAGYSSVTQDGGLSGNGGLGSGGAGGAYGNLTGSYGGRGGDGFVIITCG